MGAEVPEPEPLMTAAELAAYLGGGMKENTLAAWRHRGLGPEWIKLVGGVRYRRKAVEDWLRSRGSAGRKAS